MSLNAWKLEVCSSSSSTTTTATTASSSLDTHHRKPPKSNISSQLRRLQDFSYDDDSLINRNEGRKEESSKLASSAKTEVLSFEEEEIEEGKDGGPKRRKLSQPSDLFSTAVVPDPVGGPFEPLVLSSPDKPLVQVPASISCRLLEHQKVGVKFLYDLYENNHGGVLGDDMGLGKTIQTIALLAAVIGKDTELEDNQSNKDGKHMKKGPILIICPTSVINNWGNEFSEWGDFSFSMYHGPNRDLILDRLVGGSLDILITSFDTFRIHDKLLCEIQWDIVVVDEAHRLKNEKSGLYKACLGLKTRRRFGLTGTIMQNKILELFNLFDWVSPGSLGTREHFRDFYNEPLKHGQRLSAPERFVRIADERKQHLSSVLRKYLLRRTKEETISHLMLGKEDNVVFCTMSDLQKRAYRRMLEQPEIQCLINKDLPCVCGSPLKQVECCKRIVPNGILWSYLHRANPDGCDSCPFCLVLPSIIKLQQISNHLELIKPNPKDETEKQKKDAELASAIFGSDVGLVGGNTQSESFMELSDVENCGKMRALERLAASWIANGDKILLFSYSVRMLDILEKFLIRRGYCFSRLDGSTPMSLRQSLVDDFNRSPSKQVFLISTRAGGLGLNLVSANRVVIFDPNWNPSQDLQAQDRSFRYGQKRHVVVFRLLAAGSVEELVYSRQVYKQQLSNIAVSGKMEKRYFEGVQDCKEFQGELFGICNLFRDLSDKLFTSDIIDPHEKHEQYRNDDTTGKDADKELLLISNVEESKLHNLGIVYSHRNEDIVNMGPSFQGKENASCLLKNDKISSACLLERKTQLDVNKERIPFYDRKREEYALIAQFMGMEGLEFSRWILDASSMKLEEVLRNYKKQKTQSTPLVNDH